MVADATRGNWVDRLASPFWRPFFRLARLDRPIGIWLLLWPSWWGIALAADSEGWRWPSPALLVLFGIGAVVMRGAGCTFNDIVDRKIDARVERTRSRPLPSGQVTLAQAWTFLIFQSLLGLLILLTLNPLTIFMGILALALVAAYPFMKRVTYWPQTWLGLTINWGILMGYTAATGHLTLAPVLMYAGAVLWTIGYDTIYAHQDREDDALIGVKSTALKLGYQSPVWVGVFYGLSLTLLVVAGLVAGLGAFYYLGLLVAASHLAWQVYNFDIDRGAVCLRLFQSNRDLGALIFIALVVDTLL